MDLFALFLTFILGFFILIGTCIVFLTKNNEKFISFSLALAFGVMSSLSVFELLPESYHHMKEAFPKNNFLLFILFVSLGIILLKLLDFLVPHHAHDEGHHHTKKEHEKHLYHIGVISSIALILHNIIEGMALFGSAKTSVSLGFFMSLGIGLHNIPMGMVIASTFYNNNQNKKKTIWISFWISISTFVGGVLMFFLNGLFSQDMVLGILLSITLGMVIFIALFELLGQIIHTKHKKETLYGLFLGIFILAISVLLGGHHH